MWLPSDAFFLCLTTVRAVAVVSSSRLVLLNYNATFNPALWYLCLCFLWEKTGWNSTFTHQIRRKVGRRFHVSSDRHTRQERLMKMLLLDFHLPRIDCTIVNTCTKYCIVCCLWNCNLWFTVFTIQCMFWGDEGGGWRWGGAPEAMPQFCICKSERMNWEQIIKLRRRRAVIKIWPIEQKLQILKHYLCRTSCIMNTAEYPKYFKSCQKVEVVLWILQPLTFCVFCDSSWIWCSSCHM